MAETEGLCKLIKTGKGYQRSEEANGNEERHSVYIGTVGMANCNGNYSEWEPSGGWQARAASLTRPLPPTVTHLWL